VKQNSVKDLLGVEPDYFLSFRGPFQLGLEPRPKWGGVRGFYPNYSRRGALKDFFLLKNDL
jgi:hypothetical protein